MTPVRGSEGYRAGFNRHFATERRAGPRLRPRRALPWPGACSDTPGPADATLETLIEAVQRLSQARELEAVQRTATAAARRLVEADGATFILREEDRCVYVDEDARSSLWKGRRFELDRCPSGWAILHRRPVAIEDVNAHPKTPRRLYRRTFVRGLLITPIRAADPLGAIGMYWARPHRAGEREVALARALADRAVLTRHLAAGAAGAGPVCVALIDLDHLKAFNDRHGHVAGDELLRRAGEAWRGEVREHDVIARIGGDEFAILLPSCGPEDAARIAERLCAATPGSATASVGLARWDGEERAESLMRRADAALYSAKGSGRARSRLAA